MHYNAIVTNNYFILLIVNDKYYTFMVRFFFIGLLLTVSFCYSQTQNDSLKDTKLNELVIEKKKKAVEQRADRTIYDFSEQAHLNSGSVMEGLKKLPGLIVSEVAGMVYQGKQLEVYMDGRPLNIYSNELNSYLESLPANAIEKVEIITQPGAEFPATSGGAIINIVSSRSASSYLTATYTNGYSYTNYSKSRHRFNNSLLLSAKNKLFGWQVQLGQNYTDGYRRTNLFTPAITVSKSIADRQNRFYYIKTGLKFNVNNYDRVLVNYDFNTANNSNYTTAAGYGFNSVDRGKTKNDRHDVMLTYQKRFKDYSKKLDFRFNFKNNNGNFGLNNRNTNVSTLDNTSHQNFYQLKTDYSQEINLLDETKWSIGGLADKLDFSTKSFGVENLDYTRTTFSVYTEFQTTFNKFDFIAGGRLESYDISGKTATSNLLPFKQTQFFPNATVQYNLMEQVYLNANYNRKISLPNTSALNPNNTNYQNQNISFYGNPNLNPTIFDNYELRLNAFEYFFIGYSLSDAKDQVVSRIVNTTNGAANTYENVSSLKIHNFNLGIPLPYMLFTKGLKETLEFNFNPDEINFMYLYFGHQKHILPHVTSKGFWNVNLMSQMQLPSKIKFIANFNTVTSGGNYQYFRINKALSQQFDITFSKKFLADNLSVSLYLNDIFNTNKQSLNALGTNLMYTSKNDTRRVGISLNYKIPTKNKLAKEERNFLNNNKKEDKNLIGS